MKYDDFQILDDNSYSLMREKFSSTLFHNREEILNKILNNLNISKNQCFGITENYNKLIRETIQKTQLIITKNIENLISTFNLTPSKKIEITEFNVFTLIKILSNTQKLLLDWHTNEGKDYYKNIAKCMLNELIDINLSLVCALEKTKIFTFKYM